MQAILKKYPTLQHHKRAVAAGIILAVGIILSFVYLYLKTTLVRMKSEVIRAIQDEDAVALWRMADPMERQRLNLTPGNVYTFLKKTLWSAGPLKLFREHKETTSPDLAEWTTFWTAPKLSPQDAETHSLAIPIFQNPNGSWKLNLSSLLAFSCIWKTGSVSDGFAMYPKLAKQLGIRGVHDYHSSEYVLFSNK